MVDVKFVKTGQNVVAPKKAHDADAGFDLHANIFSDLVSMVIQPNHTELIPTGIKMIIPEGYVGMVCPRSGLALKHGVTVLNAPGIVDSGYKNVVGVILHNAGTEAFHVKHGDRIAQMVFVKLADVDLKWVDDGEFNEIKTERNEGGFGSTGK